MGRRLEGAGTSIMSLRKFLIILAVVSVVAAAAVYIFTARAVTALEGYKNSNIQMGAVSTAAADKACPKVEPQAVAAAVETTQKAQADKSGAAAADNQAISADIANGHGHARLVCLADALKATLSDDMKRKMLLPYTVEDAKKWSNFPPIGYPDRVGATLGDFTAEQLGFVKAMLVEAMGIAPNEGYDELEQILNADDYLKANTDDNAGFSSSNFHFAFLGTPAATGTWELYYGGHHTAVTNTFKDGRLVGATPSFRGVEPFTPFAMNGHENNPMAQERAAFAAVLASLEPLQRGQAKLTELFTDVIAGPQKDDNFPREPEGLRIGDLAPQQQALVMSAIETYVRDIAPPDADTILAKYRAELAETYVAFSGTPELATDNDYIRIDGPSIWIEFSMQPGRSIPGVHPHSVWRDKQTDYGGNI